MNRGHVPTVFSSKAGELTSPLLSKSWALFHVGNLEQSLTPGAHIAHDPLCVFDDSAGKGIIQLIDTEDGKKIIVEIRIWYPFTSFFGALAQHAPEAIDAFAAPNTEGGRRIGCRLPLYCPRLGRGGRY